MSMAEDMKLLEQQEKEALELARKEEELALTPTPAPDSATAPVDQPDPNAELNALKQQLSAEQARVVELTAKLNAADGRHGGELRNLREQVEQFKVKVQTLADENKKLVDAAAAPKPVEVPALDAEEQARFKEHFPTRAAREEAEAKKREEEKAELARIRKEAQEAKARAEAAERQAMQSVVGKFIDEVKTKVPTFSDESPDPSFVDWANANRPKGSPYTYAQSYDFARKELDASTIIEIIEAYEATKTPSAPVVDPAKGPAKPSAEGQALPPNSAAGVVTPKTEASVSKAKRAARIAELEYKLGMTGYKRTATVAEGLEWETLVKQEASETEKPAT